MALLWRVSAQDVPYRLELADKIRMIESGDGSTRPFFRVQFNVVSEQGLPVSIVPPKDPAAVFDVAERDGRIHRPLSLHYSQESLKQVPSDVPDQRYALILIDISGSMLDSAGTARKRSQTKYEAAKTAAGKFLGGFQPGQDHVAVVAFESHEVRERVTAAVFAADIESAELQLADLPVPQKHYNTGLYSAVDAALDVLADIKRKNPAAGALLVVLTDGQNQVLKGDDPDLLTGGDGLESVVAKTNAFGLQVMTIGFGDESIPLGKKGAIDSEALRRLSWPTASQFHAAQDVQSLGKLFGVARQLLVNRWQLTFTTHRENRGQLAGLDLQFQIRLRLDDRNLTSSWVAFRTPQMSAPPFEGKLDAAERQALMQISENLPAPPTPLVARMAVRRLSSSRVSGDCWRFSGSLCRCSSGPAQRNSYLVRRDSPSRRQAQPPQGNSTSVSQRARPRSTVVQQGPSKTKIQLQAQSSPDRTLFDPRGQQPDERITAELPSQTETRVPQALEQPAPTVAPDATLILDRLPDLKQPGQTQIQFVLPPQHNSPDRTMLDPRGLQTAVLKPDETVIDPRGEETLIISPKTSPRPRLDRDETAHNLSGLTARKQPHRWVVARSTRASEQ
jgi:Mg-chelatase subunit ChlD